MPKVYVIIVTYNAMKWAEKCFSSLRNSFFPIKTIVIDNGSSDGTQNYILNNFPEIEFIQSKENLGFGKANNIGIERAFKNGADFFYLMNQDAWIFQDSIQKMIDVYNNYPNKSEIGILSPIHLDGTEKQLDIFLDKYIANNFANRFISDLFCNSLKEYYELSFINAAHWLLPKDTILNVGGFNPYFFHYGEDNEYINRVIFHGKKVLLCTKSKVVHDGKQNLSKVDITKYNDMSIQTKILNPNLQNSETLEVKLLKRSILKNRVLLNTQKTKILQRTLATLYNDLPELKQLKKTLINKGPSFLYLQ